MLSAASLAAKQSDSDSDVDDFLSGAAKPSDCNYYNTSEYDDINADQLPCPETEVSTGSDVIADSSIATSANHQNISG